MKKVVKKLTKAQAGRTIKTQSDTIKPTYKSPWPKGTKDSTDYYHQKHIDMHRAAINTKDKGYYAKSEKAMQDEYRQDRKGQPGFDKNGYPIPASKIKKSGGSVSKMKSGGSTKAMYGKSMMKKGGMMKSKKK
jgi:hypothetical protein